MEFVVSFTCGITVNLSLKSWRPIDLISISSIIIEPEMASMILKSDNASEDFPAPVRPTIPIFIPAGTSKFISFNTKSNSGLYLVL